MPSDKRAVARAGVGDDDRESTLLRKQFGVVAERGRDVTSAGVTRDRDRADGDAALPAAAADGDELGAIGCGSRGEGEAASDARSRTEDSFRSKAKCSR